MTTSLEFGLDTFGDVTRDAAGAPLSHAQVIRNVIDEAVLADELGIDFIGLGEHHRADFAISAPEVVLAAIAARTTWQGKLRAPLNNQLVFPPIEHGRLKTWIGVGGSPESVVRAARYDLPLMLAIIGGDPKRFAPYVELYHRAFKQLGRPVKPIGVHSPGYVADSDEQAREELFADYKAMRDRIGRERGWPPMGRDEFVREADHGSLYVGSPETVARKIAATVKALGIARFQLKYSAGPLPHERLMRSIELYGRKVVPLVRDMVA
ncbi:LLM class flavin-dependent oxidoreductase [Bradyrhizobium sp. 31Argb]|uniref:LLM class flavin-dependent oxidoreductase n=1 Tax=Bradyrhizobium sp. 31Argb TaxID=3141247 RepID=UPI00374965B6